MAREISRAEAWEKAHEVFTQINFNAFDFNSIKESLLDYTKLYYPEDFNDYIESSEFVAILELFAYVGELISYRLDLNAHENLISQSQRKESILRLAKLISYKASRNIPARGLVKMSSIQTSENVIDSAGNNLAGRRIAWNDLNNPDWKEQFLLVMNRVLEQNFGTVKPNERIQLDDVLFELYTWNNNPISSTGASVFKFNATADGESFPLECVPVELTTDSFLEKRPETAAKFSILYGSDGLGDSSDTTGFFLYAKQGVLQKIQQEFDGITPNQTFDIATNDINETDIWLNHVDPDSREILTVDPNETTLPHLVAEDLRYGEWVEVDLANAQNILFNTNQNRHKYETETLDQDQVRLIFGDGEFSDIPGGSFDLWYRISANSNTTIPRNAVVDQASSFTYNDAVGTVQTLTFSYTLVNSMQNSSESEDLEHIRRVAPSVYYTQDRMVNGRDYNTFMLQDPSILKLRSVNRTFAGDSKYIAWHDPKEYYEDVKLFGDDAVLYWDENNPEGGSSTIVNTALSANELIANVLEPLLSSTDFFQIIGPKMQENFENPADMRRYFTNIPYSFNPATNELDAIAAAINLATTTSSNDFDMYYSVIYDEWTVLGTGEHPCDAETAIPPAPPTIPGCTLGSADSFWMIKVEAIFDGSTHSGWQVSWSTRRQLVHSESTRFWNTNAVDRVINFDTLNSNADKLLILQANANATKTGLLDANREYNVLGQVLLEQNTPNAGLPDIHKLSVITQDTNNDGIPDNLDQPQLFNFKISQEASDYIRTTNGVTNNTFDIVNSPAPTTGIPINQTYLRAYVDEDVVVKVNNVIYSVANGRLVLPAPTITTEIIVPTIQFENSWVPADGDVVSMEFKDWVYWNRISSTEPWYPIPASDEVRTLWAVDVGGDGVADSYKRDNGRFPLNFAWFHYTPRFHLVDPAPSNIIDTFIITVAYYLELVRWLENRIDNEPDQPTPLQLRNAYQDLLDNKMISDTVVLHPGSFKILFGSRASEELRCYFSVIRPSQSSLTDNEVKVRIVDTIRTFFNVNNWEFGETFFFTEVAAAIHAELGPEIDSIVLVPTFTTNVFGDMFQVQSKEDEIFIPDINTDNITIVQSYTPENIRQCD